MKYFTPPKVILLKKNIFFLEKYDLNKLYDGARESLEGVITEYEISEAISKSGQGNPPVLPRLLNPLLLIYNHAIENGKLPESLELALITDLPKLGNDPKLCSSYRPISLLSTDYKIFSRMLFLWIEKHILDLIHLDQTGFIQNRSSLDNVRRFFNIIHVYETDPTILSNNCCVFRRGVSFRPSRMALFF